MRNNKLSTFHHNDSLNGTTRTYVIDNASYSITPDNKIYKTEFVLGNVVYKWINNPALSEDDKAKYAIEIKGMWREIELRK